MAVGLAIATTLSRRSDRFWTLSERHLAQAQAMVRDAYGDAIGHEGGVRRWRVEFTNPATKQFHDLPCCDQERIAARSGALAFTSGRRDGIVAGVVLRADKDADILRRWS